MRTFEDDDPLFAPMLNALFAAFRGTAVLQGCGQLAFGHNLNVSVAPGEVIINGTLVPVAGGAATHAAGGAWDRYDLITVNLAGEIAVTWGGMPGGKKCPAQPADTCLLAIVFVPAGATVIATGDVYDARMDAPRLSVLDIAANGKIEADLLKGRLCSQVTLSDDIITSIPGPITVPTGSTSVKIKEITLGPEHYGTNNQYRVKYTHTLTSSGWSMSHLRINGVKVTPTIIGTGSCSYDATGLKAGDKIQIWTLAGTDDPGYSSNNGSGNITNFQLCGTAELVHDSPINSVTL